MWMVGGDDDEEREGRKGLKGETKKLGGRRYGIVVVQSSTPFSLSVLSLVSTLQGKEEVVFCSFHNTKGKYERGDCREGGPSCQMGPSDVEEEGIIEETENRVRE